ncbi:U3 small nucleolar RNA-associated protein MPP10 [Strigomonas culicis]|uniref:U3 small nucleolar RNA-associated protein MPP10 n=1 Tax=Strigomonas culicis TaxID=28005 RepID=S9W3W7_9TRYP|nr:U3 small nucleolar RNA-associated protein MPP10 [Strigomonas culicis]EPY30545.1 U3 small nucleolar RNA-associated protein MPP10 [Strigomonas culicis]|eukprot:EPY20205.1 U3 small nucleolar RNA-associated protein MPP10 [Strigomonas culicis]
MTKTVPRRLQEGVETVERLENTRADRLVLSKRTSQDVSRSSLAALYGLASRLHSTRLPFHAKTIETDAQKHVTLEQIWGQLNMLQRPVLRRLQDEVRLAERRFSGEPGGGGSSSRARAPAGGQKRQQKDEAEEGEEGGSDDEGLAALLDAKTAAPPTAVPDLEEDELDDEIRKLLTAQAERRANRKARRAKGADDASRYAFGMVDEEDWEDELRDEAEGADGDGDDDDEAELPDGTDKVRRRNTRALQAGAEEADGDGDSAAAAEEEELAVLKELYGDDFEADGMGFGGDEEDPDLQDDVELDDPAYEAGGGGADDGELFDETDAHTWGKDDMLQDEAGEFDDGADAEDPTAPPAEEVDEELERALADPTLTAMERERLREKAWVKKLEEQRLYGNNWAMSGETAANKRPREALLEADDLQFDHAMRSAPVITEAFTAKLEDRIRKRILDKHFDDVERRTTRTTADDLVNMKRDLVLDSEKSKLSLMDLYEKEYLEKQRQAEDLGDAPTAEPLTEVEKDELRAIQMWRRLAQHLDALSNFHYTPKPVQQDLEARVRAVDKQAPAIAMEAVGSFATTREQALAPQDLYRGASRKFADVGAAELTPQERHALHRAKKSERKKTMHILESNKQAQVKERKKAKGEEKDAKKKA